MKKRLISMLLALALLCACLPQFALPVNAAASGYCGKQVGDMAVAGTNLRWSFHESTGKLTITGSGDMTNWEPYYALELPERFPKSDIKSVSLPNGLTSIGDNAFSGCSGLTSITLPDSVTSIGEWAFLGCENLKTINLGNSLEYIGWDAFRNCTSLKSITIPSSVKKIGNGGKSNEVFCSSLKDVYYCGTREQWNKISVANENEPLLKANIHFVSIDVSFCGYSAEFRPDYFSSPSTKPNPDLAMLSGILSWAVYHDEERPTIQDVYSTLDINAKDYFDNSNEREKDKRFSIAKKTVYLNGEKTNLLIIAARGTVTSSEAKGDHFTKAESSFYGYTAYDLIYEFEEEIWKQLNIFLDTHPELEKEPLKVLVTGHSLGGATANLVAARFTKFARSGAWWSDLIDKEDIYCYTFGAIDSIKREESEGLASKGFENIHNIYNYHDSYGPHGWPAWISAAGRSGYGKFGHLDLFFDNRDQGVYKKNDNHMMWTYLDAVKARKPADNRIFYDLAAAQNMFSCQGSANVSVYKDNKLVGQIVNNKVIEDVTIIPMGVAEDSSYWMIPTDETYHIEFAATGSGKMELSCSGAATGLVSKKYANVNLKAGKKMYAAFDGAVKPSELKLFVVNDKGTPVAEVQEDGKEVPVTNPFFDVKKGSFYYDAVLWAVNHAPQITNGIDATHFGPEAGCTRGQVVTFLWRTAGCPEPASKKNPFQDVKQGAFYYKAVLWAVDKGITKGTSATAFSPNATCTRGQIVTFLYRFKDSPKASAKNPFKDVSKSAFYYSAMLWAVENGVTNGTSKTTFSPGATCTRGQVVTFLYRASRE